MLLSCRSRQFFERDLFLPSTRMSGQVRQLILRTRRRTLRADVQATCAMTATSAPWLLAAWVLLLFSQCNAVPLQEQQGENREVLEANSGARMFHEPTSGGADSGVVDKPLTAEDVTRWFNTRLTPDVVNRIMDAAEKTEPLPQFFDEGRLIPYSVNGYKGPPGGRSDVEPMIDLRLVYSSKTETPSYPPPDDKPEPSLPGYHMPLLPPPPPPPPIIYPSPTRSSDKPQTISSNYKSQPPTPPPDYNSEPILSFRPQSSLPPLGIYPPPVYKPQPSSSNYKSQTPTPQPDYNAEPIFSFKTQSSLPSLVMYPPPPPPPIYKAQPISVSFEPTPPPTAYDSPAYNSPPPPPPPPPIVYDPNYKSSPPPETFKPVSSPAYEPQLHQNSPLPSQYIQLNSIPNTSQRLIIVLDPNQLTGQSISIPLNLLTLPPGSGEPTTGTNPYVARSADYGTSPTDPNVSQGLMSSIMEALGQQRSAPTDSDKPSSGTDPYVARRSTDYVASQSDRESSHRLLSSIMDPQETFGQRSAPTGFDKPSSGTDPYVARSGDGTSTRQNRSFVSQAIDHFSGLGDEEKGSRDQFQPGRGQQNGQWNSHGNQMMGRRVEEEGSQDHFQPGKGPQNGQWNSNGNPMMGQDFAASRY